jgi:hypothetical protein
MDEDEIKALVETYRRDSDWVLEDDYRENDRTVLGESDFEAMRRVAKEREITLPPQQENTSQDENLSEEEKARQKVQRANDLGEWNRRVEDEAEELKQWSFTVSGKLRQRTIRQYQKNDRQCDREVYFEAVRRLAAEREIELPPQDEFLTHAEKAVEWGKQKNINREWAYARYLRRGKRHWENTNIKPDETFVSRNKRTSPNADND